MISYFRKPNFVFFGTPDFARTVLEKLIKSGFVPHVVVCNLDRPVGRKQVITPPPVKTRIMSYEERVKQKVKIWQPEKLESTNWRTEIGEADFGVVASYAKIIPKEILTSFKHGILGVHPSLLPRHRGASPIQASILEGDAETGVTIYLLDEKVDHGPVLAARRWPIANSATYISLEKELAEVGGDLLVETIPKFLRGGIKTEIQDETKATYTKKIKTDDAYVDLEKDNPVKIERKIRALNPEPGVWTLMNGKRTKLLEAEIKDGKLVLKKIQVEGKKPRMLYKEGI